jgi:hypothetical protein
MWYVCFVINYRERSESVRRPVLRLCPRFAASSCSTNTCLYSSHCLFRTSHLCMAIRPATCGTLVSFFVKNSLALFSPPFCYCTNTYSSSSCLFRMSRPPRQGNKARYMRDLSFSSPTTDREGLEPELRPALPVWLALLFSSCLWHSRPPKLEIVQDARPVN